MGQCDVLIVGAGPTGLTLACELARRGVSFRLIDKCDARPMISKAAAIMPRSLEVFENIGVADEFLEAGTAIRRVAIYSRDRRIASLGFEGLDTPYPMMLGLPQFETERLLEEHLGRLNQSIQRSSALAGFSQSEAGVTASVLGPAGLTETVQARYLVGCDGAHSHVRQRLHIPFEGSSFHEHFIVAHVEIDWDFPRDEFFEFHAPGGTISGAPLPENTWSISFELDESQWDFDHPPAPSLEELQRRFDERSPLPGKLHGLRWSSFFRINQRQAPAYRVSRAFLAGDAAHIHSPAGGQGMNTGIQDAYNLAWKLAHVCQGVAPADLLDSYHAERHPIGKTTVRLTTSAQAELNRRNRYMLALRDAVTRMAGQSKHVRRLVACQLGELCYGYRRSPIVSEFRSGCVDWYRHARVSDFMDCLDFGAAPHAGDRASDAMLTTRPEHVGSAFVRMYDLLRGLGHKLFLFEGTHGVQTAANDWPTLRRVAEGVRNRYGDRLQTYVVLPRFDAPRYVNYDGPIVFDGDGTLHKRYGARGQCLYAIRPDGHIGYRSDVVDGDRLDGYLAQIMT